MDNVIVMLVYLVFCWFFTSFDRPFFRSIVEESLRREIFEEYIGQLQEKVKEKERKREEEKVCKSCLLDVAVQITMSRHTGHLHPFGMNNFWNKIEISCIIFRFFEKLY